VLFDEPCALQECEYLVVDNLQKKFIVFSVADVISGWLVRMAHMPQCAAIYFAQYSKEKVQQNCNQYSRKWKPWI
jgi:hypothetical protein